MQLPHEHREGIVSDLLAIRDAVLAEGRALSEAVRLTDRATVHRKTGRATQDESTGEEVPIWQDPPPHSDLAFRVDGSSSSDGGSHVVNVGGVDYEQATAVGQFPATTDDLADGDFIEVTSGEWAGSVFSIVAAITADQKTARRVPIREEQRPQEWDS
jgi:hypothetical protein